MKGQYDYKFQNFDSEEKKILVQELIALLFK